MMTGQSGADPSLVGTWIRGWALSRSVEAPVSFEHGWRVEVGLPQQRARYVFPCLGEGVLRAANAVDEPFVFLKVCGAPDETAALLPKPWVTEAAPSYFMTTDDLAMSGPAELPEGYHLEIADGGSTSVARVRCRQGDVAASGHITKVGAAIIFDRIETSAEHQRIGLGSAVMRALGATGLAAGGRSGLLVATSDGRALYGALGWDVRSLYATAAIPETAAQA